MHELSTRRQARQRLYMERLAQVQAERRHGPDRERMLRKISSSLRELAAMHPSWPSRTGYSVFVVWRVS